MVFKPGGKAPNEGQRKFTPDQVREALIMAGTKSGAAKILKCDRKLITKYCQEYRELDGAIQESKNILLDVAETGLMKNVKKGHPSSIFFTLKTLGKERGYVERVESTGKDGAPIDHIHKVNPIKRSDAVKLIKDLQKS